MKNTFKQITAGTFIALLILVGNVKADGTETKGSNSKDTQKTLQLENWMTDETIWNINSFKIMEFVQETESNLELENWMTNANSWNVNNSFIEETETGLELESWMTSDETWITENTNVEPKLRVESWMTDSNLW